LRPTPPPGKPSPPAGGRSVPPIAQSSGPRAEYPMRRERIAQPRPNSRVGKPAEGGSGKRQRRKRGRPADSGACRHPTPWPALLHDPAGRLGLQPDLAERRLVLRDVLLEYVKQR